MTSYLTNLQSYIYAFWFDFVGNTNGIDFTLHNTWWLVTTAAVSVMVL